MQFKQASRGQGGFTLIELIVVIVILGILAATALPKFADMSSDARRAKMQGARGAVSSAANLAKGQFLASGLTGAQTIKMDGTDVAVNASGYPLVTAIATAAGLSDSDYTIDSSKNPAVIQDVKKTTCQFTYDETNGTVTAVTALSTC